MLKMVFSFNILYSERGQQCMCNRCLNQYIGKTIYEFRKFKRGQQHMQRHLYEQFNLQGHSGFLHDISVTLTDKKDP